MENEPQIRTATREVWWIAMLALSARDIERPKVGDWAIECSHLAMLRKHSVGFDIAIGKVVSIDGSNYEIEARDGTLQRWENAYFIRLPQPAMPNVAVSEPTRIYKT